MTSPGKKVDLVKHECAAGAQHSQSDATFGTPRRSPKARDIEALALSNMHGDPTMQFVSSRIRSASDRVVQQCSAIARRLANLKRAAIRP
jgi:hypothetical protein